MKTCPLCGEADPTKFDRRPDRDGRRTYCKECRKEHSRDWWKSKPLEFTQALNRKRRDKSPEVLELIRLIKSQPCIVCGTTPVDCCHIKSKGAGGQYESWNIVPMCRAHHSEQHQLGFRLFLNRYPQVIVVLESMGWELIDEVNRMKLFHPRAGGKGV